MLTEPSAGQAEPDASHASTMAPGDVSAVPLVEDGESSAPVERLLDDSWDERLEPFTRRERMAGAGMTVAFIAAAGALATLAPVWGAHGSGWMILVLAIGFAVASRVEFPIGAGYAVPTQLFLVPLFVVASEPMVPLIVLGANTAATLVDVTWRKVPFDRLVDVGVDSWHAIAPTVVILAFGGSDPGSAPVWLFPAAFLAQVTSEVATSTLRLWLGRGISPQLQVRVLASVWAIDLLLTPIGLVAALAAVDADLTFAPIALFGVVALLALLTRDRTARIEQAHVRLEALRAERTRLEVAVQRIGDAFASKLDLDALLNITMRAAVEALDADGARASAYAGPGRKLVRRATMHEDGAIEPALVAAEKAAARRGAISVVSVDDVFAVACPIRESVDGAMAGVIALARQGFGFTDRKRELLQYLCDQAGVAAGDIERHTMLHRQALTDELTGLANHRRLQEVLALGTDAHGVNGAPLALILFDLDNFKQVNDTRGHQTGDHVLRAVSDVLRGCCRGGDEAARYGGEELAIVLHATDLPAAVAVAERARAAVAALELVDMEGRDLRVTTSVGVAALGAGIRDPQALIAAADAALYEAKRSGKNRVHFLAGASAVG